MNAPPQTTVTLYVVPNCPLCAHARTWLQQHEIAYEERDVASNFAALRAMYRLTQQRLVPVFAMNGAALVRPTDDELSERLSNNASSSEFKL